ncbi:uncharacterized protein LOC127871936 isoform X2 [Dreissena polymorpha]|uniref:uncharacterized protein LOC127871936 isoform X2 n=1 Tax=Dreissena polymorpha TaxID=45954 RepID=UPI002263D339|nr:uncharacterized protein LOC127871936 isoform X2 [Dreissena polymorpha]
MALEKSTAVYIGNLKLAARILELKSDLLRLFGKVLKVSVTANDISIVNGPKRYAIIDVHNEQNVACVLQNIVDYEDRKKLKFKFENIEEPGTFLHVDTVKSQDDKQSRDDFENGRNPPRPFSKPHLHVRKRPDYGRIVPLKSASSNPMHTGRLSRQSSSTQRSQLPASEPTTDLDVTLDDYPVDRDKSPTVVKSVGEALNTRVNMVPMDDSTLKDSDDSGTQVDLVHNRTISSIHGEGDDEHSDDLETSEYEDPPGSVIDLRHISRASMRGKLTPRIHRRTQKSANQPKPNIQTEKSSTSRKDFFAFLDAQIGPETPAPHSTTHVDDESTTPYYKPGEIINNHDQSKEFKAYLDGKYTLKKLRDHAARCAVGFLNSGKKGMLLIGVESRGRVVGIDCELQQEDRYRRHFLDAMKEIYPPVFGDEYSIHFAPLLEDNGRQHPSLKVIEIRVFPPENQEALYECNEGVFVRRNGSLTGPIKASHIQEWVKQKQLETFDQLRLAERYLKDENERKDDMLRKQADTILAQKSEIERQKMVIEGRTCTIL